MIPLGAWTVVNRIRVHFVNSPARCASSGGAFASARRLKRYLSVGHNATGIAAVGE